MDLQEVPQELTQMSADTKTGAAAADKWCFTAGSLSRVMRGSDHRQTKRNCKSYKRQSDASNNITIICTSHFPPKF